MLKIMRIVFSFFFFMVGNIICHAQKLRAVTSDLAPYSMPNPGRMGFTVEVLQASAKQGDIDIDLEFMPWARALEEAKSRPDTIVFTLVKTQQRGIDYNLFLHVLDSRFSFVTIDRTVAEFSDIKSTDFVGTSPYSPQERDLLAHGVKISELNEDQTALARMLEQGRIDIWYTHPTRAAYLWKQLGFDPARLKIASPNANENLVIGANRQTNPVLLQRLTMGFQSIVQNGTYANIHKNYFGDLPLPDFAAEQKSKAGHSP